MEQENMPGKGYDSFQRRILWPYAVLYPDFVPDDNGNVSISAQNQLYMFMKSAMNAIYQNPDILGFKESWPDDFYDGQAAKDKPDVYTNMKKVEKKLENICILLTELVQKGEKQESGLFAEKTMVKLDKNKLRMLSQIGLQSQTEGDGTLVWSDEYPDLFGAFPILLQNAYENNKLHLRRFVYCVLHPGVVTSYQFHKTLVSDPECIRDLEQALLFMGYKNGFGDQGRVGLTKEYKGKTVGSFYGCFDPRNRHPLHFEARIPAFRILLQQYHEMDSDLQALTFACCKHCDHCGYCTQTDKTGQRKPVAMTLTHQGETQTKCPLYPGFVWNELDRKTTESLIKLFTLAHEAHAR